MAQRWVIFFPPLGQSLHLQQAAARVMLFEDTVSFVFTCLWGVLKLNRSVYIPTSAEQVPFF